RGSVSHGSFHQPLAREGAHFQAELPVALLSGEANEVQLGLENAKVLRLRVAFHPRTASAGAGAATGRPQALGPGTVGIDPSCSHYGVSVDTVADKASGDSDWTYFGCRLVGVEGEAHRTSSLELYVLWEGADQELRMDGTAIAPASA